ncbi:MAG: F0F1 ATP synthase subunit epsilon [Actinomycetota bacterium]|nr:F0F1 ATP synthase subunit epsilon [Actinomycetota bacterium]PLS76804.1 MAG: F0F1 ATP synthase subunit epsilon [Actinomycetota bacterium]
MALDVDLVSPERILFSGEAEMVVCRTSDGEVAFLTGHVPFLGGLGIGIVRVHLVGGDVVRAAVHGGFVQVKDNKVIVLSDVAELPGQIDVARARRSLEEAQRRAAAGAAGGDGDTGEAEADAAAARIQRAQVRLELAGQAEPARH